MSILTIAAAILFFVAASARGGPLPVVSGPAGLAFPVSGSPFSAQQVEQRMRSAPDGTSTIETLVSQIHRDSAGRMRIEWRFHSPGGESLATVYLIDPVAHSMVVLLPDSKKAGYLEKPHPDSGSFNVGFPAVGDVQPAGKWQTKTQALAARVIEGVEVEGERTIQTSEDQQLIVTRETWRSRALRLTFAVEASGPSWKHTAKLQNFDRHEPDPALFVIPPDYVIQDM